ncbi:hypothetical protein BMS3Bbin14_01149 [bacterium BMS3Bbin14]|nr:hypothetical protein BMS3Abin13_01435 [bacterium BMS3Abin13]GBE52674.1 hypothetical protein BMS3Bbin14_01149 [bacterium BMS3Bbin14]
MKKIILTTVIVLTMAIGAAGSGNARMMDGGQQANMAGHKSGMMMGGGMGMKGNMMGSGMMGGKQMMGPGMMGSMMMGPGMMGPGMMGPGMMGPMMMGPGMGMQNMKRYNRFMNKTKDLRRKLYDMGFDYGEAMRNPKTTIGDLQRMRQEMGKLQRQIMRKMPSRQQ